MNWVGGSRSRCMLKNDARKQREFFEKNKMQKKIEHLGLAADPQRATTGSIDLVTLFIVNQIAAKKENKNSHKVSYLSQRKGAQWPINEDILELPMSPCSPSRLCLMESQPHYSVQRKRKHHLSALHNIRQLSPVLESNFSDCSASDYRRGVSDTISPSSSATSSSQSGTFPVGQRGEPREVRESTMLHRSQLKVHYPPVSRVQFGSTESSSFISTQKSKGHAVTGCFLNQEDQETALVDFESGEYSNQATTFDNRKTRIVFQEESQNSMLIGVPKEFQSRHQEADFLSQPVDSAACSGHGLASVRSCGSVCSSPCEGFFSPGSDIVGIRRGEGDQFVPSRLQPGTAHRRETRAGQENRPYKSRETGTQTETISRRTSDASTQCSPGMLCDVSTSSSVGFPSHSRPVSHRKHKQTTRGQCVLADEVLEVDSHVGTPNRLQEEGLLPQSKSGVAVKPVERDALTGHQLLSGEPANLYRPKTVPENWRLSTPAFKHICLNKTQVTDELRKEQANGGQRQVKQLENNDHPAYHPAENLARREGGDLRTESTLMSKVSEDTATMQEVADILLMMKQKNKF